MSKITARAQKVRTKGCGCGSSRAVKSRNLNSTSNTKRVLNRPIKARNLR